MISILTYLLLDYPFWDTRCEPSFGNPTKSEFAGHDKMLLAKIPLRLWKIITNKNQGLERHLEVFSKEDLNQLYLQEEIEDISWWLDIHSQARSIDGSWLHKRNVLEGRNYWKAQEPTI